MPPVCPPLDFHKPPILHPRHVALFAADPLLSRRSFALACQKGDTALASAAAWSLAQQGQLAIRDPILYYAIESIGSAEPVLVELMRGVWGALRPNGPWDPVAEWPGIAKSIDTLANAPTGLAAMDLLIHCVSPVDADSSYQALRQVRQSARKRTLQDRSLPLVERLAAALALADTGDPVWSPEPPLASGSTFELMSALARLGVPECLLESVHFAARDHLSAPGLAHALVCTTDGESLPMVLPDEAAGHVAAIEAGWLDGGVWGSADLPDVLGLPLAAFGLPCSFGPLAMEAALMEDVPVIMKLQAQSSAEPAAIVDTVLKRADRRLLPREQPVAALPFAAALGDLGAFADIGVGPDAIAQTVKLVRPLLPKLAANLTNRLTVLR
jgi:hypothetical protein